MSVTLRDAARARQAALSGAGTSELREAAAFPAAVRARETPATDGQMRASTTERNGKQFLRVAGFASVYERGYEMFDWYGPYTEVVSDGAGAETLAASPDVVFLENHRGIPLARTITDTLDLSEPTDGDTRGLWSDALMNPKRTQAADLWQAIDDQDVREMSFAFYIRTGHWSPDYSEYRIDAFDLDRGDTSAVTFGANPATSIEARAALHLRTQEVMRALGTIEGPALAAAHERLAERIGRSAAAVEAGRPSRDAVEGLRLLRAAVEQGQLGAAERAQVAAVLRGVEDGTLAGALAEDGTSLPVLLGVAADAPVTPAAAAAAAGSGLSLELAEALLATS